MMMRILNQPDRFVVSVLGEQTPQDGIEYRRSIFTIAEGNALFNALTGEAVADASEGELMRRWFYVPTWMDEYTLAYITRQRHIQMQKRPGIMISTVVVYLTTGCNASCEYCFEQGYKVMTMTEQTAKDAAEWVAQRCDKSKALSVRWFGGEPLTNIRAINAFCETLDGLGVSYHSDMFTNGDLMNEASDEDLKKWRLKSLQLTIDDIGDEYAKIKGLPAGAFDRIAEQITRLCNKGLRIRIRTHFRGDAKACQRVADTFSGTENLSMYPMLLYGGGKLEDYEKLLSIEEYLIDHGLMRAKFPRIRYGANCMADSPSTVCITPDGHLSPCEHFAYGEDYGSIYERKVNVTMLRKWADQERNHCGKCLLYPLCSRTVACPGVGACSPERQYYEIATIKRALRSANR